LRALQVQGKKRIDVPHHLAGFDQLLARFFGLMECVQKPGHHSYFDDDGHCHENQNLFCEFDKEMTLRIADTSAV
jgi:hypothetical protein